MVAILGGSYRPLYGRPTDPLTAVAPFRLDRDPVTRRDFLVFVRAPGGRGPRHRLRRGRPARDGVGVGLAQIAGVGLFFYTIWSRIRPVGSQAREANGARC